MFFVVVCEAEIFTAVLVVLRFHGQRARHSGGLRQLCISTPKERVLISSLQAGYLPSSFKKGGADSLLNRHLCPIWAVFSSFFSWAAIHGRNKGRFDSFGSLCSSDLSLCLLTRLLFGSVPSLPLCPPCKVFAWRTYWSRYRPHVLFPLFAG